MVLEHSLKPNMKTHSYIKYLNEKASAFFLKLSQNLQHVRCLDRNSGKRH